MKFVKRRPIKKSTKVKLCNVTQWFLDSILIAMFAMGCATVGCLILALWLMHAGQALNICLPLGVLIGGAIAAICYYGCQYLDKVRFRNL